MSEKEVIWVPITARITSTKTGETRDYLTKLYTTVDYDGIFQWEEGNYSCDCNRYIFFENVIGRTYQDITEEERPCSDGLFTVELIRDSDNVVIYSG